MFSHILLKTKVEKRQNIVVNYTVFYHNYHYVSDSEVNEKLIDQFGLIGRRKPKVEVVKKAELGVIITITILSIAFLWM